MFNRHFFERDFAHLVSEYVDDRATEAPVVEFHLRDGSRYRIERIVLIGESWISFRAEALGGGEQGKVPAQVTCPYAMLSRVDFFPRVEENLVGFRSRR